MLLRSLKWRFIGGVFTVLMFFSLAIFGQEKGSVSPAPAAPQGSDSALPPIEQALVPEGVFALQLAKALKISQTEDETQAQKQLGELGIEPKNGWITEYPVTPDVIGDIEKAVATAADSGKLQLGKDQALKLLADVKTKLGLSISAAPVTPLAPSSEPKVSKIYKYIDKQGGVHITNEYDSIPEEYRKQATVMEYRVDIPDSAGITAGADALAQEYAANPDQQVVNNYYYISGPPVVTYYPPPGPYYYLYAWTPSPFWCSGFFFRGFFVLRDFHKHIWFNKRRFAISNRFDRDDIRRRQASGNIGGIARTAPMPNRLQSQKIFDSPQIRNDARAILRLNSNRRAMPAISPGPRAASAFPSGISRGLERKPPDFMMNMPLWNRGIPQDFTNRMYRPPAFPNTTREYTFTPRPQISTPRQVMPRNAFPSSRGR